METAHNGIELKPLPGLKDGGRPAAQAKADDAAPGSQPGASGKLSRRSFEVIGGLTGLFRDVAPAAPAGFKPGAEGPAGGSFAEGNRPAGRFATP